MSDVVLDVAAGLLQKGDGRILLGSRPEGKPWPGWWELPGGKIEAGETPAQALERELDEELGIRITQMSPWVTYTYRYPRSTVRLYFHRVTGWTPEPQAREGQVLSWHHPLKDPLPERILPASIAPLRWHTLPARYLLTSIGQPENLNRFLNGLEARLNEGIRLVQFREPGWTAGESQLLEAFRQVISLCHAAGAACLVNSTHPQAWWAEADGVHLRSTDAQTFERAPDGPVQAKAGQFPGARLGGTYLAVSAHNEADLARARQLDADFVVLGHVLDTPSHPEAPGMGWARFARLREQAGLPVFAIGGQSEQTLPVAITHGAHGIAMLRAGAMPGQRAQAQ